MSLFAHTKQDKVKSFTDLLMEDKRIDIDELDKQVDQKGYKMSIYEKLFVLKGQIGYLQTLRDYYIEKESGGSYSGATGRTSLKLQQVEEDLAVKTQNYEKLNNKYSELFTKSMKYYY